jgi:hypothetical protein
VAAAAVAVAVLLKRGKEEEALVVVVVAAVMVVVLAPSRGKQQRLPWRWSQELLLLDELELQLSLRRRLPEALPAV